MADQDITRKILLEIDRDPSISQKRLAEEIGLSVGTINWHVKRCVGKGLIKLQQAPVRRYLYYLTPEGFAEKAMLTASYLRSSFDIFKKGREQYEALFNICQVNGWSNAVLLGDTEITELALLVATRYGDVEIVGIIDEEARREECGGIAVARSAQDLLKRVKTRKVDAVIACHYLAAIDEFTDSTAVLDELKLDRPRLLIPGLLQ